MIIDLQEYGFLFPKGGLAASAGEAAQIAAECGFPVVLKIANPDILHKTDVGGVELGCDSGEAVREAYDRILRQLKQRAPEARI